MTNALVTSTSTDQVLAWVSSECVHLTLPTAEELRTIFCEVVLRLMARTHVDGTVRFTSYGVTLRARELYPNLYIPHTYEDATNQWLKVGRTDEPVCSRRVVRDVMDAMTDPANPNSALFEVSSAEEVWNGMDALTWTVTPRLTLPQGDSITISVDAVSVDSHQPALLGDNVEYKPKRDITTNAPDFSW